MTDSGVSPIADHFSGHASAYAAARPTYPAALFDWLATLAPSSATVWDCGTGNGQAAVALAERFAHVVATDVSAQQIDEAAPHPKVTYAARPERDSGLGDASVGLVTVAQALHWFDPPAFAREVERVLVPGGHVVAVSYRLFEVTPAVDAVINEFYDGPIGPFWPPQRAYVDAAYATWPWPWPRLDVPAFDMTLSWTASDALAYLRTWSAVRRCIAAEGADPVDAIDAEVRAAWGPEARTVRWPLTVVASRVNPE